ncbi:MAG: SMP-30/gluconolactonase/LRE family protein [Planctomycetota bacterium]
MTRYAVPVVWLICVTAPSAAAEAPEEAPLIPPDAVVEVVSTGGYRFTEGPALAPDGSIYFSDIPNNAIHRYDPATGKTTLFTDDSGGANGLMFMDGHLYACAGKRRTVDIYPAVRSDDGQWESIRPEIHHSFDSSNGRFNSPNDIVFNGREAFMTDPRYGKRDDLEKPGEFVYSLDSADDLRSFAINTVAEDLVKPNGIGISPDRETLYIADNGDKKIFAYKIHTFARIGDRRLLHDLSDLGGPDGMTVDHAGRLYVAIFGKGILILSPDGERLGFLETGPQTTNCVFGADGRTLYVTAEKALKRVVLNTGAPTE